MKMMCLPSPYRIVRPVVIVIPAKGTFSLISDIDNEYGSLLCFTKAKTMSQSSAFRAARARHLVTNLRKTATHGIKRQRMTVAMRLGYRLSFTCSLKYCTCSGVRDAMFSAVSEDVRRSNSDLRRYEVPDY